MGFPVGYTELVLPKLFLNLIFLLGLLRRFISRAFRAVGLGDLLDPTDAPSSISWPPDHHLHLHTPLHHHIYGRRLGIESLSATLIQEILPVVFYEAVDAANPPESCAVCLFEFESGEEVRRLSNCRHVFHRWCLDPWVELDQRTCPLCRTLLVPEGVRQAFDRRVLTAAAAERQRFADDDDDDPYPLADPFTFLLTSQSDAQLW